MSALLVCKERMKAFYDKWGQYIRPFLRFLMGLLTMLVVHDQFGYYPALGSLPVMLIFSIVSAFLPATAFLFIVGVFLVIEIYSVSLILAIQLAVMFLVLYLMYLHFVPEHGYTILMLSLLNFLKIPYVLPIVIGLIATPAAVVPVSVGVIVYYLLVAMKAEAAAMANQARVVLDDDTLEIYNRVFENLFGNQYMFYTIVIFALVIVLVYIVRRQKWNYASYTAICCGALVNVLGFLIVDFLLDQSGLIPGLLVGTLISVLVAGIVQFFKLTLNYPAIEIVQFEDDEYYYYVKAVPKMTVSKPDKQVTRINPQKETENTANLRDAIQQAYSQDKKYVESIPEFDDDDMFDLEEYKVEYDEKDFID